MTTGPLAAPGVGERIRAARRAAGLSLRELGRRVGVSASFLSQVELGRAMPSMGTLWTIVSELGLSFDALLGAEKPEDASGRLTSIGIRGLQREGTAPEVRIDGVRWERLTAGEDPLVEFRRVTYDPGSESSPADAMMRHVGTEYMHVMSGRMDIQVGFDRDTVQPGDSLTFDASIPHRLSNPYAVPCVSIWAVVHRPAWALDEVGAAPNSDRGAASTAHLTVDRRPAGSQPA